MSFQKEYVRSMKMAANLMLQGFRILAVEKDKKNDNYDVYIFKHTPAITKAMLNYIERSEDKDGSYNKRSRSNNNSKKY